MIAIPHGLAAEVLRALQDGPLTTAQIVDAIDRARGRGEEPGVEPWRVLAVAGFLFAAEALTAPGPLQISRGRVDFDRCLWKLNRDRRTWELRR